MKLVRYGRPGKEKPGLIDGKGRLRDLSAHLDDITPATMAPAELRRLKKIAPESLPAVKGKPRMGVPVSGIGKIVCIGLNYTDHAEETGNKPPESPIAFFKPTTALTGPNDPVRMLRDSHHMDWEVELGVVIGRRCTNVDEDKALSHIAGYCTVNDVSERKFQSLGTGQWIFGKSGDTFCPVGPWLVTADEVGDPQKLKLWCDINGKRMQDGTTANMIFPVAKLVSYVSRFMTLEPGDLIPTGTPAGVGLGRRLFLKAGDKVRLGVDGLGEQETTIVAAK